MGTDVAQTLADMSDTARSRLQDLSEAKKFASHLENDISKRLDPVGETMRELVEQLEIFEQSIAAAIADPESIPAPMRCGIVGETTVRTRFGLNFAAQSCTSIILGKLASVFERSKTALSTAREVKAECEEIAESLKGSQHGLTTTLTNCHEFVEQLRRVHDQPSANMFKLVRLLELTHLSKSSSALQCLPAKLSKTLSSLQSRINILQEFRYSAGTEIKMAFILPFPLDAGQALIIGENPPLRKKLIKAVLQIQKANPVPVSDALRGLLDTVKDLPIASTEKAITDFVQKAKDDLGKVVVDLGEIDCKRISTLSTACRDSLADDEVPPEQASKAASMRPHGVSFICPQNYLKQRLESEVSTCCDFDTGQSLRRPYEQEVSSTVPDSRPLQKTSGDLNDLARKGEKTPSLSTASDTSTPRLKKAHEEQTPSTTGEAATTDIDMCSPQPSEPCDDNYFSQMLIEEQISASVMFETFAGAHPAENSEEKYLQSCPQGDGM